MENFEIDDLAKARFDAEPLEKELQRVFKNITLESPEIKTGYAWLQKEANTNSVWPFINHPKGSFFQ